MLRLERNGGAVRALSVLAATVALTAGTTAASAMAGTVNPNTLTPTVTTLSCGHGVTSLAYHLPKGFNPLTATDTELLANNLPTPPSGARQHAVWKNFVEGEASGRYHTSPTCSFRQGHPGTPGPLTGARSGHATTKQVTVYENDSANWAGNVANDEDYYDTYGTYQVPSGVTNGLGLYTSSSWVGEGQGGSDTKPLVQAGTESDVVYDVREYYIWWEVVPELYQQVVSTDVGPGDTIWVHIHFVTGSATMTVLDENRGEEFSVTYGGNIVPDDTAEWILERTEIGSSFPMLASNSTTTFTGAEANYGAGVTGVSNLNRYYQRMYNCTSTGVDTQLAAPGPISSDGSTFTDYFENNGIGSAAPCVPY